MEYEVTEEIVTSSRRLGYSPNLFYFLITNKMYEEMFSRTVINIYGRQHKHWDKVLIASVTNSSADYGGSPDVSTLVIKMYNYSDDSEAIIEYKQLIDEDFNLHDVNKMFNRYVKKYFNIEL